jgi:hypothetical protein
MIHEISTFRIKTGQTDAAAGGYRVFLKPLPKGNYDSRFQGACELGRLNAGADYKLEII